MWQLQKTTNLLTRLIVTLVFVAQFLDTALALSDKRLCADENCKDIISFGTGVINYRAGEEGMLSFKINAPIRIKSKGAGKDPSLWGIEVGGREGYAPKRFIRETRVKISDANLQYEVDVVKPQSEVPVLNSSENVVGQGDTTIDGSTATTTTKPLDMISVESNEDSIVKNPVENASSEKPAMATPVLMEMVDGTQIPVLTDNADDGIVEELNESDNINTIVKQSDDPSDDDYEIGDYDDDDEEENLYMDNGEGEIQSKTEPKTVNPSIENSEIKTNEIKEINNTVIISEKTNKNSVSPQLDIKYEQIDTIATTTESFTPSEIDNKETQPIGIVDTITSENLAKSEVLNQTIQISENAKLPLNDLDQPLPDASQISENEILSEKIDAKLPLNNLPQSLQDASEISENETKFAKIDAHLPLTDLPQSSPDASQISENEIKSTNIDASIEVNELHHPTQEELQSDIQTQQQITKHQTESSLKANDQQPITNENLKVPDDLKSIPASENHQQVPTETIQILEENTTSDDNTKEALITASVQENNINVNNANNESLPDNKTVDEENLPLLNHDNLNNEEKTVSHSTQEQSHNTEKLTEQNETQRNGETVQTIGNIQTNQESILNPEPTTQTEPNHAEQLVIEPAIVPKNQESILNPEPTIQTESNHAEQLVTEPAIVSQNLPETYPQTITETPSPLEIVIPQTSTALPLDLPSALLESEPHHYTSTETPSSLPAEVVNNDLYQQQTDNVNPTPYNPYDDAPSNTPLPPQYNNVMNHESSSSPSSPLSTEIPQYDYYDQQGTGYVPSDYHEHEVVTENPIDSHHDQSSVGYGSVEPILVVTTPEPPPKSVEEEPKALPSLTTPFNEDIEIKENKGLFATIMGTVNNMLSSNKRAKHDEHDDLHKILYPSSDAGHQIKNKNEGNNIQYCEKLGPNGDCPHSEAKVQHSSDDCDCSFTKSLFNADFTFDTFSQALASKILEISELLAFLAIVAASSLFFIFGYYCFCNSSREGALLSKLNQLESSLLATHKENAILKHNLMATRQKLASIEDNSFGSNDMVVSLKTELEEELVEKARLQEQITNLQKELENAADAGIELNKIVSELLSNQTGDESIISSVEELQKQLNEQQNTILEINASLAEKSRENSELQLLIAEQNARYESEIANLQRDNDELEQEKGNLQTRLEDIRNDFDKDITVALEGKNFEIKRLQNEIVDMSNKIENEHTKWQTSMAKVEALEECLRNVKRDPNVNITQVIDVANIRAELLDAQKKYTTIKERLEIQLDSRKLAENQLQIVTAEVEKLKQDFNLSEKDKLEAQTRLEVLSNYFKDKENQLQKELSLKEAIWLKQQGETTTTVDRLTAMKEEIQSLKSQNDSLRAEIEAQVAAHKAQTGTLENRAHETWLAARQSDRRYEEARAEATALRRKLTALAGGGNVNEVNKPSAGSAGLGDELTNAPSPIHMESPGSPMLGRMPPPPFLPPPFMGPPPPFMGMPPPPFVTPGEMRPAPLGRIMSPPPQRSGRFSPPRLDYEDYLDYEGNNTWHRHTYSPPPRTYRSLSPTDSRYDYENERDLMSIYDTEADFSPPPSPRESRRRGFGGGGGGNGSERGNNNTRSPYNNSKKSNSGNKGPPSSGSEKSYNSSSHHGGKAKHGGNTAVGKSLV